jgi:hypothetical protein
MKRKIAIGLAAAALAVTGLAAYAHGDGECPSGQQCKEHRHGDAKGGPGEHRHGMQGEAGKGQGGMARMEERHQRMAQMHERMGRMHDDGKAKPAEDEHKH